MHVVLIIHQRLTSRRRAFRVQSHPGYSLLLEYGQDTYSCYQCGMLGCGKIKLLIPICNSVFLKEMKQLLRVFGQQSLVINVLN
jgi:hypothetical protein